MFNSLYTNTEYNTNKTQIQKHQYKHHHQRHHRHSNYNHPDNVYVMCTTLDAFFWAVGLVDLVDLPDSVLFRCPSNRRSCSYGCQSIRHTVNSSPGQLVTGQLISSTRHAVDSSQAQASKHQSCAFV